MEDLFQRTRSALEEVHSLFLRLERSEPGNSVVIENEIQALLNSISENCCQLDIQVNKVAPSRRTGARIQLDQLKYDCRHYRTSLQHAAHKRLAREQELLEREQLLSRRFATNEEQNTAITIDAAALQHHASLQGAHSGMDELLGTGSAVLGSLREQRLSLKGAHRKILDIANTLGLSNTVMRLIEKRSGQDRYILFGGMAVVCIVMVLVLLYFT